MKTIEELYSQVIASKEIKQEFLNSCKANKTMEFLKKYDCNATEAELKDFMQKKIGKKCEISDAELANVSGGCTYDEVVISIITWSLGC